MIGRSKKHASLKRNWATAVAGFLSSAKDSGLIVAKGIFTGSNFVFWGDRKDFKPLIAEPRKGRYPTESGAQILDHIQPYGSGKEGSPKRQRLAVNIDHFKGKK
jgi:hypothetical protein